MTYQVSPERAVAWLEGQLESLGTIRNASTRDTGFRVWRQETLGFIQQIWPTRPGRWSRFRRVPFAPASARADEAEARETFERGFAEMRKLLKMWIAEVKLKGLVHADDPSEHAEEPPKARKATSAKPNEPLKQMLDLGKFDLETEPPQTRESTPTVPPAARPDATASAPNTLGQTISDALVEAHVERRPSNGSRKSRAAGRSAKLPPGTAGIAALAKDLEAMGVPASEREQVRVVLTDLAQRLDAGSITWGMLQAAVAVDLILRYPKLARRALSLFQPSLDKAA
jgi:hypothetical protein